MKNRKYLIALFVLTLFSSFVFGRPVLALEDAIIAIVNDDIITNKDLLDYLNTVYTQLKLQGRPDSQIETVMMEIQKTGVHRLIEDKLILNEANKKGIEAREEMVDERVEEIKAQYPSEEDFLDKLIANGATVTDLREKIQEQMKIKYVIDLEINKKIFVNPQEVTDYYKDHLEDFKKPERLKLDSIFISRKDETAINKANQVLNLLKEGKSFPEVSEEYSEMPSIGGTIDRGQLLPEIENIIFQLNEEETSPIIETDEGLYIFKIREKLPSEMSPLEEVKEEISSLIFQIKFKERFKTWIEQLKENAFIEIKA